MSNAILTGKPSVDRPWLKDYPPVLLDNLQVPPCTLRQYLEFNMPSPDTIAMHYYGVDITWREVFERADACAIEPQLGESALAIDEYIVAHDVKRIAYDEYPHRHLGIGDAFDKLAESVGGHDKEYGHHHYSEIGFDDGYQLLRLPHTFNAKVYRHEHGDDEQCRQHIGH